MPGRAAIFVRSSDSETPVRDEVQRRGFSAFRKYRDICHLMFDVRRGELAAVLVFKLSDFAQSTRHLSDALAEFRKHNVQFISLTEGIDTSTAMGEIFPTIVGAIVAFEHSIQSEKIHEGLDRARRRGVRLGRRPNGAQRMVS
jgi:DNA invertase Pin-like site-specific DNA recombinase